MSFGNVSESNLLDDHLVETWSPRLPPLSIGRVSEEHTSGSDWTLIARSFELKVSRILETFGTSVGRVAGGQPGPGRQPRKHPGIALRSPPSPQHRTPV